MAEGTADLQLIQSICCLVYWKVRDADLPFPSVSQLADSVRTLQETSDNSAWLKVGFAIRLGYSLRLHARRTVPLPPDEMEARRILDGERTWLNLICFERVGRAYIDQDQDGAYVNSMVNVYGLRLDKWLAGGEQYGLAVEDRLLVASVDFGKVQALSLAQTPHSSIAAAQAVLEHSKELLAESYAKYVAPLEFTASRTSFLKSKMSYLSTAMVRQRFLRRVRACADSRASLKGHATGLRGGCTA